MTRQKRKRRTKAEMAMVRAKEAYNSSHGSLRPATPVNQEENYVESKQRNCDGKAAKIPAMDRWLLSELERIGGAWKVSSKPNDGMWSVLDQKNKRVAMAETKEIAEAISVIPRIICTYTGNANVFAMTDVERDFYREATQGLFEARMFLQDQ